MKDFDLTFDRDKEELRIKCDHEILIIGKFVQVGDEYHCSLKPVGQVKLLKKIANNL